MKVTVCFGSTKVVVPCGGGDLLVSELVEKATTRYRKALGKSPDYWLTVHSLKSSSDGGILDLDDQLKDVADDREQIVAYYEEQEAPPVPHNGGDGTSASSVGTSSPDIFQGGEYNNNREYRAYRRHSNKNDVIVTKNDLNLAQTGSSLIVRRGSEPALTRIISDDPKRPELFSGKGGNKRWSAIASLDETKSPRGSETDDGQDWDSTPPPTLERVAGIGQEEGHNSHNSSFSTFSRGSSRRSLANNAAMIKWLEAQEKAQEKVELQPGRKEPLGGDDEVKVNGIARLSPATEGQLVVLGTSTGPLGIHVVPQLDDKGRERGLQIQSVEAGGRIYRDGRIHTGDVITEINGTSLSNVDFAKAQEVFRQALHADQLCIRVVQVAPPLPQKPPPIGRLMSSSSPPQSLAVTTNGHMSPPSTPTKERGIDAASPPASPVRGPPPPIPSRNPTTTLSAARFTATNTRKLGKKLEIQLTKGSQGLGFSVTTRDNLTGGHTPIYIKNILPKGAAIEDGQLKPGDRLLEVNGIEMTGKSQTEVVAILRNTKIGGAVNLVVSRQVLEDDKDTDADDSTEKSEEVHQEELGATRAALSFDISMDGQGSAGLGLNVKGKTLNKPEGGKDLGIFIKAIIPEGAAAKDGRIQVNDQLLEVNGDRLEGNSNPRAMEILRHAVQKDGPVPGCIHLVVSRKTTPTSNILPRVASIHEVRISQSDNRIDSVGSRSSIVEQRGVFDLPNNNINSNVAKMQPPAKVPNKPSAQQLAKLQREQSLRNVSYQMANHDSMINETIDDVFQVKRSHEPNQPRPQTVKENVRMRSTSSSSSATRVRPASTLGFMPSQPEPGTRLSISKSNQDLLDSEGGEWMSEWQDKTLKQDGDEMSPTDDIDPSTVFQREGFGRQSMSEKRKGHVDPRMTEFYQKIKSTNKEAGSNQFLSASWDPRRSAFQQVQGAGSYKQGLLKRVASAESLLTHSNRLSVHDLKPHESLYIPHSYYNNHHHHNNHHNQHPAMAGRQEGIGYHDYRIPPPYHPPFGLVSYRSQPSLLHVAQDSPAPRMKKSSSLESVQRAAPEETATDDFDDDNVQRGRGCNESFRAAVDRSYEAQQQAAETMETVEEESETGSIRSRAPSFTGPEVDKKNKKNKKEKEKGIFKGLFKFGKTKKHDEKSAKVTDEQSQGHRESAKHDEKQKQLEEEKYLEHQRRLLEKQRQVEQQKQREEIIRKQLEQPFQRPESPPPPRPPQGSTRAEKITQLRQEHQRRHREREGQYPQEEREEQIERHLQDLERQKQAALRAASDSSYYGHYGVPPRNPYDDSVTYERALPAYANPDHYSHYQNLREIQAQIRKHEYYQHQYHQQQTPGGATPHSAHYSREVNMPPPAQPTLVDPRYHQRGYATPHHADHRDMSHYHHPTPQGYYTPHQPMYRAADPSRSSSQTPSSQGYHPHPYPKVTPQIVVNPPPKDYVPHPRGYADFEDPRSGYRDPPYGSLPRRREHRESGMMPGAAQV